MRINWKTAVSWFGVAPLVGIANPSLASGDVPYVIVTDVSLVAEFTPLADAHTASGLTATIETLQDIRQAYPAGRDDAEKIRMFLQDAHAQWRTRFVLIGGADPLIPMRSIFIRGSAPGQPDIFLPTDQYYACLAGSWNADGDSLWGELPYPGEPGDSVSFYPDVNVGRAPVLSAEDAHTFVQKTLLALATPAPPNGFAVLMAAQAIVFGNSTLDFAPSTEALLPMFATIPGSRVTRLYQLSPNWPGSLPETRSAVLDSLAAGYDVAVLAGQGGVGTFVAGVHPQDDIFSADLTALHSTRLAQVFALSAYTTQPGPGSIGAALMLDPNGGAVSVIGCTNVELIATTSTFMKSFFDSGYFQGVPTVGEALSRAIAAAGQPSNDLTRLTTQGNALFGDPALPLAGTGVGATPTAISFARASTAVGRVTLDWYAGGAGGLTAVVQRRTVAAEWTTIGDVSEDGTGALHFEDDRVVAGTRYGYRLALSPSGVDQYAGETWVDVPAVAAFALRGFSPNPASRTLAVSFSLPDAARARLELFDLAGRCLSSQQVGSLGEGSHLVTLARSEATPPGIYLVRLTRGRNVLTTRGVVIR